MLSKLSHGIHAKPDRSVQEGISPVIDGHNILQLLAPRIDILIYTKPLKIPSKFVSASNWRAPHFPT
jgi:hypothetical protein